MALNKVNNAQLQKFGSLTTSTHIQSSKSIFGDNGCKTVCSYTDSFSEFTANGNSYDIFSTEGQLRLENQIKTMTCQDAPQQRDLSKSFELNEKSLMFLQQELDKNNVKSDNIMFNS